jgi:hypothetical protein
MSTLKNSLVEILTNWDSKKDPVEIAKIAFHIHLDFNRELRNDIKLIITDIMITEADECMLIEKVEIDSLMDKIRVFVESDC